MNSGTSTLNRIWRPALAASLAVVAIGCVPPDPNPGTTTTASTSSTVSVPPGSCDDYTPTNVAVSNPTPSAGTSIVVSGNGAPGANVAITLRKVSDGSIVDPGAGATVANDGTWSTSVGIPVSLDLGEWDVVAISGDDCSASARIDVIA